MDYIPDVFKKPILILGCGNILFGDDGFGPAVIQHLEKHYKIPENICAIDTGTGVRELLFDIVLAEKKPEKIIIVDAVDTSQKPGEIFEIEIDAIPHNKVDDFSMHQVPTSNLLKELKNFSNVDLTVIVCQVKNIPELVKIGLSEEVEKSIPEACNLILKKAGG